MKPTPFSRTLIAMLLAVAGAITGVSAEARSIELKIGEGVWQLNPGLKTKVWAYNGSVPGTPIIVNPGDDLTVTAINNLNVATSIHWHGIEVPFDQDGMNSIAPGKTFVYHFKVPASGTFWYHSHTQPVLDQVDMGLYGAFIVKAPEDTQYSSDQVFVLDDWYLGPRGERLKGTARGGMERLGNVDTVNGKTADAIPAVKVTRGELHKFRFINASTAAVHTLKVRNGRFRVTHTDGHPLTQPYLTDTLVLQPAERFDVEYSATGDPGSVDEISTPDADLGLNIAIAYGTGTVQPVASPFVPPPSSAFAGIADKKPDYTLVLNSRMAGNSGNGMKMDQGMSMDMGGMSDHGMAMGSMPMEWTINGKSFPNTTPLTAKVGQIVKIQFVNNDTQMMHPMDHPIHLHGAFFQVVSINGKAPERETWKDTIAVPAGQSVEIAFRFKNPGDWMLHCHILDHEDNGMVTIVKVTK